MDIRDWGRIFQCFSLPTPTALDRIEAKVYIRGRGNETKSWIGKSQAIDRTLFLPLCGTEKRDCAPGQTGGADFSRAWSHRRSELNSTRLVAPAERNKHTTARLGEPAEQRIKWNYFHQITIKIVEASSGLSRPSVVTLPELLFSW